MKAVPIPLPAPVNRPLRCRKAPNVTITVVLSDTHQATYAPCQIPSALRPVLTALMPFDGWPASS